MEKNKSDCRNYFVIVPKGDVAFLNYKLNNETFLRLWQYLEEYKRQGYDKIYNGENKPREGKGAGCSAYGVSFIEVGDLMPEEEMAKWQISANIPEKLIGGQKENGRWVSFYKIIFKRKWADTLKQKFTPITLYEPELLYNWIVDNCDQLSATTTARYQKELRGNANGIVIDCTHYPVPHEPIWYDQTYPVSHHGEWFPMDRRFHS